MSTLAQSLARTLGTTTTLGMESVDVDVNIGQDAILDEDGASVSPLAPATDEPIIEAQQTELVEQESEIESTDAEVESNDNDIETLESIQLHLEKSIEHGGLDTVSYEMFNVAMDHIYRKFGFGAASVLPSMESFNDDNLGMTTVSMEKVTDTLKSVKEGAAQTIKKLWFQLKEFLKGLFTFNLTVKKRAEAIAKAASGMDSSAGGDEIKLYNAKYLTIGGKVPEKGAIVSGYTKMAGSTSEITKVLVAQTNAYGKVTQSLRNASAESSDEQNNQALKDVYGYMDKLSSLSDKMVFAGARFEASKDGDSEGAMRGGNKFVMDNAPERGGDSEAYKVKALNAGEVKTVARAVSVLADTLTTFDKTYDKKLMEEIVVKHLPMLEEGKDGKVTEFKMGRSIKKGIRAELTLQRKYLSFLGKVNKAMLDYCAQSLQVAKKGAGKKEETKAAE